jgi:putative tryptophan/tyrosine transport system substrate-binding protein
MRRRDFITLVGGVAVVSPFVARAQEPGRIYRLAFLIPSPRQAPATIAFFDELRRNGFTEGQNLVVIPDGFEADTEHPGQLAATLVKAAPDAVITGPALPLRAFQSITHTIPLVGMSEDMVAEGLVASLAKPGGNITGISLLTPELDSKRQEILIEAVPGARRIAAMADSNATAPYHLQTLEHAARSRGVDLVVIKVAGPEEIPSAIDAAKASGVGALNFLASPLFSVPAAAITRSSWNASRHYAYPRSSNFRKSRKRGHSPAMEHALVTCIVSGRKLRRKCFAAPSPATFRCSSLTGSNWSSI